MNDLTGALRGKAYQVTRNQHPCWELFLCTGGSGTFLFDGSSHAVQAGDLILVPPGAAHAYQSGTGTEHITLYAADTALTSRIPVCIRDDENHSLQHLVEDAYYLFHQDAEAYSTLLSGYVQLICQHIARQHTASPRNQLVTEIAQSILQNYADPHYELDELLRSAPYCYDYLCRLFRQEMHTTPHKYLSDLRLQFAAEKLRTGSVSVTDVARLCGHSDPLYFSRIFKKKYGISPREYARQHRDA